MGNQESKNEGLILDKKSIETPDGWNMLKARMRCSNPQLLSLFSSDSQSSRGPKILELASKNLMLHRHPNIIKYVTSWTDQDQFYVLTERVWPLTLALEKQTPTQICAGLHSILKALVFLHEKAESSHNNVCCCTIYVTTDGAWKLGGFEHLQRFCACTPDVLAKLRPTRNDKAVPPEEKASREIVPSAIDAFAFGVLAEQVLQTLSEDHLCDLREFRALVTMQLQHENPASRPLLSSLLNHAFFQNPFVLIHDFLTELPMKSNSDKDNFFKDLLESLRMYPQVLVAKHLAELLLSRIVVLDRRAREYLLPALLRTSGAPCDPGDETKELFTLDVFQKYLVPRLLKMFQVHDTQIRLILLNHFRNYCFAFSKEQLLGLVLPEVMFGLKDKNDEIVAATLNALASLVPILGGGIVLGGKQCKIFSDCLPSDCRLTTSNVPSTCNDDQKIKKHLSNPSEMDTLPERPSPDGGEDVSSTGPTDEETDIWSDWDADQLTGAVAHRIEPLCDVQPQNTAFSTSINSHSGSKDDNSSLQEDVTSSWVVREQNHPEFPSRQSETESTKKGMSLKPQVTLARTSQKRPTLPDITSLDIKCSVSVEKASDSEFDFFRDMEPVISKTELPMEQSLKAHSRFDVDPNVKLELSEAAGEGWGDGTDDWSDIDAA